MAAFVTPSYVIVTATDYVTVTPTSFVAIHSSIKPTLSSMTIGTASPSAGLSISSPTMSIATASVPLTTASHTGIPPLPSQLADAIASKPKFNDTFAIMTLVAVIVMGVLLGGLLGYMVYLRCKGECPRCKGMKEQVGKWERGELKRITKDMVKKREAMGDGSSCGSVVDLEKGTIDHSQDDDDIQASRAAALDKLEGIERLPFWNGVKGTIQKAKDKVTGTVQENVSPPIQTRESNIDGDRFFTVQVGSPAPNQRFPSQVHYEPGDNRLYDPPSPSVYSQVTGINGPRTFGDRTGPAMLQPRRSRRDSADQPSTYTAYLRDEWQPRNREHNIQQAEAGLCTQEYKAAERAIQRDSTTESEMHHALDVVNKADRGVHRARHPSMYTALPSPKHSEDGIVGAQKRMRGSYQMPGWRHGQGEHEGGFF